MKQRIIWTAEMEATLMHLVDAGASYDVVKEVLGVGTTVISKKVYELYSLMAKHEKQPASVIEEDTSPVMDFS